MKKITSHSIIGLSLCISCISFASNSLAASMTLTCPSADQVTIGGSVPSIDGGNQYQLTATTNGVSWTGYSDTKTLPALSAIETTDKYSDSQNIYCEYGSLNSSVTLSTANSGYGSYTFSPMTTQQCTSCSVTGTD